METAVAYVTEQLSVLVREPGVSPAWFAPATVATLVNSGAATSFNGDAAAYLAATSAAIGNGVVTIGSVEGAVAESSNVVVTCTGTVNEQHQTRAFSLSAVLSQSDAQNTYYLLSETFAVFEAVATEPEPVQEFEPAAAPAAEEQAEPAEEKPAAPAEADEPAADVAAKEEDAPADEPAAADEVEADVDESSTATPPTPPSSPVPATKTAKKQQQADAPAPAPAPAEPVEEKPKPKPSTWAALAASNTKPMQPAPKPVAAKPATPPPEPAAPAKEAPKAKPVRKEVLQTCTFKAFSQMSDDAVRALFPAALQQAIVFIRNRSGEPTNRVWIDFAIADAVAKVNDAKLQLDGKTIYAEVAVPKPKPAGK